MTADGPRPLFGFLPWLLASVAVHAALLVQWPQAGAPAALVDDVADSAPLHVQLVRNPEPAQASPASTAHTPAVTPRHTQTAPAQAARTHATAARPASAYARSTQPQATRLPGTQAPAGTMQTVATANVATTPAITAGTSADGADRRTNTDDGWSELMSLLHAAIDRHKRYPQSALSMGREGSTRVDFRLRPDGHIDDLNIGVSSGVRALDLAAYRAVQAIAPFADADRYLDGTQRFQVDVVFRIN